MSFFDSQGLINFLRGKDYFLSTNIDLICIVGSWLAAGIRKISPPGFKYFVVKAESSSDLGRASGGISLYYKINLKFSALFSSQYWVFSLIEEEGERIVVGVVYLNKDITIELAERLHEILCDIKLNYSGINLLVGGDWNLRVGEENQVLKKFSWDASYVSRIAQDKVDFCRIYGRTSSYPGKSMWVQKEKGMY